MPGKGTEQGLMKHLMAHLDAIEKKSPPPPPLVVKEDPRGSVNHKRLFKVSYALDAGGDDHDISELLEFFATERERGHCCSALAIETCSATHDQLNEAGSAVAYLRAVRGKHEALREAAKKWWWDHITLCRAGEIPGARDDKKGLADLYNLPGWRAWLGGKSKGGSPIGVNSCRDLCGRLIEGFPVPPMKRALWRDKYNVAARALSMLPAADLEALRPPAWWEPAVPYAFRARSEEAGDEYIAWFEAPDTGELAAVAGVGWLYEVGEKIAALANREPWVRASTENLLLPRPDTIYPAVNFNREEES